MRQIAKLPEPAGLLPFRKAHGDDSWKALPSELKEAMRTQLVDEQHGLCAYCCRRITDSAETPIEHLKPRSRFPALRFTWSNLVASCPGGKGQPGNDQTCDSRKATRVLRTLIPVGTDPSVHLNHLTTGQLHSANQDATHDIENVLNLNHPTLRRGRQRAIRALVATMSKKSWSAAQLQRRIDALRPASGGTLAPYQPTLVYWLTKQLRKRA